MVIVMSQGRFRKEKFWIWCFSKLYLRLSMLFVIYIVCDFLCMGHSKVMSGSKGCFQYIQNNVSWKLSHCNSHSNGFSLMFLSPYVITYMQSLSFFFLFWLIKHNFSWQFLLLWKFIYGLSSIFQYHLTISYDQIRTIPQQRWDLNIDRENKQTY